MNRGTRTLVVLVVAVLAAAAASYGVYTAISNIPERRVEISTRKAVVASTQLSVGQKLTSDLVKVVDWPERTPVQGGFADIAEVLDRGLISGVVENEPITESKLAAKGAGAGMPPTITPGMRAISVRVNDASSVAGFVAPGTRVDVMTIIQRANEDPFSRVVVSNVQVLTANTRYDQEDAKKGESIRSTVVTLMVSPMDAERITLAQAKGELMLTLRNPLDVQPTESTGVSTATLFGAAPKPASKPTGRKAPPAPELPVVPVVEKEIPYTVESIRGAKRSIDPLK